MMMGTNVHARLKNFKEKSKELGSKNRILRKVNKEMKNNDFSWKKKHAEKQYEVKIEKNKVLTARRSRDRWQNKYMRQENERIKEILASEKKQKETQAQLEMQKEENEQLKKQLEEKKTYTNSPRFSFY